MKRIQTRTYFCIILCLCFVAGIMLFLYKYYRNLDKWTLENYYTTMGYRPGVDNYDIITSPPQDDDNIYHAYYTDENNAEKLYVRGSFIDRVGRTIAVVNEKGITFNEDSDIREAMIKPVGDRYGNISTGTLKTLSNYFTRYITEDGEFTATDGGNEVRLTTDAHINEIALDMLGDYVGVVGVYNYLTGEILCDASTPVYDPDDIPDDLETNPDYSGCYLDSFYSSTFQPGSIMKTITLECAIDTVPDLFKKNFTCYGSMTLGGQGIDCTGVHYNQDIATAYANSCNCAFAQVSELLTRSNAQKNVDDGLLTSSLTVDGSIHLAPGQLNFMETSDYEFAWSCIGLHYDLVNPASFMIYLGCVANSGKAAIPTMLKEVKDPAGNVIATTNTQMTHQVIKEETADTMRKLMVNNGVVHSGNFSASRFNKAIGCKTGTTTREDGGHNGWFIGFIADREYPFAFVCFIEDAGYGSSYPGTVAATVMNALCTEDYRMPRKEGEDWSKYNYDFYKMSGYENYNTGGDDDDDEDYDDDDDDDDDEDYEDDDE